MLEIEKDITTPPFIKSFEVKGLFGYKNMRIDFNHKIKITAAENGNGKTTILNIFYATLNGDVIYLKKYNFKQICIFFGDGENAILQREDLFLHEKNYNQVSFFFDDLDEYESFMKQKNILTKEYSKEKIFKLEKELSLLRKFNIAAVEKIMSSLNLPIPTQFVRKLYEYIKNDRNSSLAQIKRKLLDNSIDVLYLPTYRRIESDAPEEEAEEYIIYNEDGMRRKRNMKRKSSRYSKWDDDRLLNFVLDDVDNKLKEICEDIKQRTLRAYSDIGGSILDNLLSTNYGEKDRISIKYEALQLILNRLGKGDNDTANKINKLIESKEIYEPTHSSLYSLLLQLVEVYSKTENYEKAIEKFSEVINSYWEINNPQERKFVFNKADVETEIVDLITEKKLELSSLSSGEKQIFSIFARLYLNSDKNYIVLIDEPELSLSIAWQRKFLVDIATSPSCRQLLAITHSPFVFDNELDRYTSSFIITNSFKDEKE